jgi:hypothetical protein
MNRKPRDHFICQRSGSTLEDGACAEHERPAAKVELPEPAPELAARCD